MSSFLLFSCEKNDVDGGRSRVKIDKLTFFVCCWSCCQENHSGDLSLTGALKEASQLEIF